MDCTREEAENQGLLNYYQHCYLYRNGIGQNKLPVPMLISPKSSSYTAKKQKTFSVLEVYCFNSESVLFR